MLKHLECQVILQVATEPNPASHTELGFDGKPDYAKDCAVKAQPFSFSFLTNLKSRIFSLKNLNCMKFICIKYYTLANDLHISLYLPCNDRMTITSLIEMENI